MKEDILIVGSNLEARKFAAKTGGKLLYNDYFKPVHCKYYEPGQEPLQEIFSQERRTLKTNEGKITKGPQRACVWDFLSFLLAWNSQIIVGSEKSCVISHKKDRPAVEVKMEGGLQEEIIYNQLYVFEPWQLQQCPGNISISVERKREVYDWNRSYGHRGVEYDALIHLNEEFVQNIHFFNTEIRRTPNKVKKSFLAYSELDEDKLTHPEYTRIFTKFVVSNIFEEYGIDINIDSIERKTKINKSFEVDRQPSYSKVSFKGKTNLKTIDDLCPKLKEILAFFEKDDSLFRGFVI